MKTTCANSLAILDDRKSSSESVGHAMVCTREEEEEKPAPKLIHSQCPCLSPLMKII